MNDTRIDAIWVKNAETGLEALIDRKTGVVIVTRDQIKSWYV